MLDAGDELAAEPLGQPRGRHSAVAVGVIMAAAQQDRRPLDQDPVERPDCAVGVVEHDRAIAFVIDIPQAAQVEVALRADELADRRAAPLRVH